MSTKAKSESTRHKPLLFNFKADTITTVSHKTLVEMAAQLGFNETQTLHFAIARLRDELRGHSARGSGGGEEHYPPLTAAQLLEIRRVAPAPRGKLVKEESMF